MNAMVRIVLTVLMALTLNASMVFAATTQSPGHHTEAVTVRHCDHHGHRMQMSDHAHAANLDDCQRQVCPSCTGLPPLLPVLLHQAETNAVEPFALRYWSPSWRPPLFRPPIQI
ncbi:hypothetical protein [Devosia sp. XK-2]|uniref:hypothetical protein n=1 Tax=Devosia sp. XK-2 TaxID=3126689 RepID=UPI0030D5C809